jgi:CHAT domain-containing protein/tetratricopeptide (TPR) repeat protein
MEFKKKQDRNKTQAKPTQATQPTTNLQQLLQQIGQLTRPGDLPQRIALIQQAIQMVNRQTQSELWGTLQVELGNNLQQNPLGRRAENLEKAIEHYQLALTIRTRHAFPEQWTTIQNNLATAYLYRIMGSRAENSEKAIEHVQLALTILTREAFPEQWATTQNNLAMAYKDRIMGSRAENLEKAIEHVQLALEIYTREAFPEQWATTQNNLATAYAQRIAGNQAENLERAIEHYQLTLTIRTREAFPQDWATTQNNLATAYAQRIAGSRAENLEKAIEHYQLGLEIRTREAFPQDWATTQNNLAATYADRIAGSQAENLEKAIEHYQLALVIYTHEAFPEQWATTQNNLATVYANRIAGSREENLEKAIKHYQLALAIYTRQAFPEQWATTQNNLAMAYKNRIKGRKMENLEKAIEHYQLALGIRTHEAFPQNHRLTQRNLGNLYFDNQHWVEVDGPYQAAIRVGKQLLKLALTPEAQQAEINETDELFSRTSYANLHMWYVGPAFFTLEQGKTQLLTQTLALYEADVTMLTPAQKEELDQVREGVRVLETELRLPEGSPGRLPTLHLTEKLKEARATLDQLIDTLRQVHPNFMPEGFQTLAEVLAVIPPGTTVIAPAVTSHGAAVFVVPHGLATLTESHFLWLPTLTTEQLNQWLYGTEENPGWLYAYRQCLDAVVTEQALKFEGMKTHWTRLLHTLGQEILLPVRQKLAELNINPGSELLFLPQAGLGLLPLHAAVYHFEDAPNCLTSEFTIRYTPSLYTFHTSQERAEQPGRQAYQLLACINPTKDLPFTPFEGLTLDQLFAPRQQPVLLREKAATRSAVVDHISHSNYFHFSGHGTFGWADVQQSGLKLTDGRLTMTDILTKLNLTQTKLVVLSACETGITDLSQNRDEFFGLPAAFLQAGSPAVLSTLWAVDDLSTTLFMREFYTRHLAGEPLAEALRQSQLWLRNVTGVELVGLVKTLRQQQESAELFKRERHWQAMPDVRPFEHPFYWACFVLNGV